MYSCIPQRDLPRPNNPLYLSSLGYLWAEECIFHQRVQLILENTLFSTWVKQRLMLDYLTAGIAFWMTLFAVQESLLEFCLGYLGRYWFLAISASLLFSFLLSAPITITLIIKFAVDPFTFPGNVILCTIAAVIFGVILSLSQGYKGTKNFKYTILL